MSRDAWAADLDACNAVLRDLGAVVTEDDGFRWVDETRAPADLVRIYDGLRGIGYARGWL